MNVNRNHKDRLFRLIFGDPEHKERTLELYNALNQSDYSDPDDLTIVEIKGVVYMSMKNDVGFLIDMELNLWEHQSTYNPNMPLRGLMHLAQHLQKYIDHKDLNIYGRKLLELPTPRYYIFYNGEKAQPDEVLLKLTDSFPHPELSCVEVTAIMLNINYGHNCRLLETCRHLQEYAMVIHRIREATKRTSDKDEIRTSVIQVIDQCINEEILGDILSENKKEVIEMLLTEYDEKETMRRLARDERAEGREEGRVNLLRQMLDNGDITMDIAAKNAGMTQEAFAQLIQKAKESIPDSIVSDQEINYK